MKGLLNFNEDYVFLFVFPTSNIGEGCLYETITNVAPINNQETVVNL